MPEKVIQACANASIAEWRVWCTCENSLWLVNYKIVEACKITMADDSLNAKFNPSRAAAQEHERCHCRDYADAVDAIAKQLDTMGPFATAEACNKAINPLSVPAMFKANTASFNDHNNLKYKPGGACYSTGDF